MSNGSHIRIPVIILLLMSLVWPGGAARGLKPDGGLDRDKIKRMYYEAEFEPVRAALEDFLARRNAPSREDRIFAFKYLSVIYASSEDTRNRAESYMYQLLRLDPDIDLIDLYISENIESIFNTVKNRFSRMEQLEPGQTIPHDETASQVAASTGSAPVSGTENTSGNTPAKHPWLWYTAGGAGLAALVAIYALSVDDDEPAPVESINIPLE